MTLKIRWMLEMLLIKLKGPPSDVIKFSDLLFSFSSEEVFSIYIITSRMFNFAFYSHVKCPLRHLFVNKNAFLQGKRWGKEYFFLVNGLDALKFRYLKK